MEEHKLARKIIKTLQDAEFKAYLVGGCVRDMIMKRVPKDYDIATSATPDEIEGLFSETLPIGKAFGVMQVRMEGVSFEVATFRTDGEYSDGRRPDSVEFSTLHVDAGRRDFTINALYYDPETQELVDLFGGVSDIGRKLIRFVGFAILRINEDRLRMLRAVRLAVCLGFEMDTTCQRAIQLQAELILDVSPERTSCELDKMFTVNIEKSLQLLSSSGLLPFILPEVARLADIQQSPVYHPEGNVFIHTATVLGYLTDSSLEVKWAGLLHDVGKYNTTSVGQDGNIHAYGHHLAGATMTEEILTRLRYPVKFIDKVTWLVENHMRPSFAIEMRKSTLKRLLAEEWFDDLLELHRADSLGSNGNMDTYNFLLESRRTSPESARLPPPLITGQDLINLGFTPGPEFKRILRAVEDEQLEGRIVTNAEAVAFTMKHALMDTKRI